MSFCIPINQNYVKTFLRFAALQPNNACFLKSIIDRLSKGLP